MKLLSSLAKTDLVRLGIYFGVMVIPILGQHVWNPWSQVAWPQPIIVGGGPQGRDIVRIIGTPAGVMPHYPYPYPPYPYPNGIYTPPVWPGLHPPMYPVPTPPVIAPPVIAPPVIAPPVIAPPIYPPTVYPPNVYPPQSVPGPWYGPPGWPYPVPPYPVPIPPVPGASIDGTYPACQAFCHSRSRQGGKCVPFRPIHGSTGDVRPAPEKLAVCPANLMCSCDDRFNKNSD